MPIGEPIYFSDVQSDIDMKNTYKLINYPVSTNILNISGTVYVDAVNGSSGGIRGTTAAFQTLAQAQAVALSGDVIEIRSDLTYSGEIIFTVPVTLDFRNHVITPASQTDSRKITFSADGCYLKNLEVNGAWDGSSTTASSGSVIRVNNKRCTVENVYVHDSIDTAIELNGNFSDNTVRNIKLNNIRLKGVSANSQNITINRVNFDNIAITNTGDKAFAVARGGAESNQVYGVNIRNVYYDTVGTIAIGAEAMYVHGLTDFNINNIIGAGNAYNLSIDSCHNGTVENVITRGGLGVNQFAGLEIAWGRNITVNNCVFDGLSKSGATSIASGYGGIQCSNLNANTPVAGNLVFTNIVSLNWYAALTATDASGVNISGGVYSGSYAGTLFRFCDNVLVTGADISAVGSDGFDTPIAIDSGAGGAAYRVSNNNYRLLGNSLNASAGCTAEIEIKSQDANHTIDGVTIKNNIRRDSIALANGTVKQTVGAGGAITNLVIHGNQPTADWSNDDILSNQANTFTANQTVQSAPATDGSMSVNLIVKSTQAYSVPPVSGVQLASKYNAGGDYAGMGGLTVLKQNATDGNYASYVALHARENGQNITERLRAYVASGINYERMGGASGIIRASGAGSPEGVVTAPVGSVFYRTDGGTGTTFYVKQIGSGNTGWTGGVSTVGGGATIATTTTILVGDNAGNAIASTETGTGNTVRATSPTLTTPTIGVATATSVNKWTLTAPSTAATVTAGADNLTYSMPEITTLIGFRHIPQNSKSANYTTVLADSGKEVYHPVGDNNARTFTIDSNANVAYPIGTVILFTNMAAASLSVAITSDTMTLLGSGLTGTRTVAQYGSMAARKDTSTSWIATAISNVT